jgi:hypothetical protein
MIKDFEVVYAREARMNRFRRDSSRRSLLISGLFLALWLGSASCGGTRGVPAVNRSSERPANSVAANSESSKLQLGAFQELTGTDYLMATISTPQEREYSSKGPEDGYTRNFLFVNIADKSSHLLFPTHDYLISSAKNLTEKAPAKPASAPAKNAAQPSEDRANEKSDNAVKWICYRVIKADTDNDKRLTANDLLTLALSDASGLNYTELISDIQAVLHETRRGDALIFIYKSDGKNQIAEINLQTKQVTVTKDLQEIAK